MTITTSEPKTTVSNVTVEWMHDKRIVVYKFKDISRATLDAWLEKTRAIFNEWDNTYPFLCLMDFSDVNLLTVTPYLNKKSHEASAMRPDLSGRTAVLAETNSFFVNVIKALLNSMAR